MTANATLEDATRLRRALWLFAAAFCAHELEEWNIAQWFARNYDFFGAPAALFCYLDLVMGPGQWSDLGMFLQTFMLLAQEEGLDTCAQESWSRWPATVSEFVGAGDELMLFCGMSIGYQDPKHPVNQLDTERERLDVWAHFL